MVGLALGETFHQQLRDLHLAVVSLCIQTGHLLVFFYLIAFFSNFIIFLFCFLLFLHLSIKLGLTESQLILRLGENILRLFLFLVCSSLAAGGELGINEEDRFSDNFKRMHFALHACDD